MTNTTKIKKKNTVAISYDKKNMSLTDVNKTKKAKDEGKPKYSIQGERLRRVEGQLKRRKGAQRQNPSKK